MALFRITVLLSLASVILCAPIDQVVVAKTNANGTSIVQTKSFEFPKQNETPVQSTTTVLLPLTATSANLAGTTNNAQPANAIVQAGPMGRSDPDYNAEGRDLSEALGLMSTFLTPKLMQPGAASASMTPASSGPQAAPGQQQQMLPQQQAGFQQPIGFGQQQPIGFGQQQPMVNSQFPQQQGFINQQPAFANQQVPLQQNIDPRLLAFGVQPGYGQGAYQQPSVVFNQPMPFLQARAGNNAPQQVQNTNLGQPAQGGSFNGMPVQNTLPTFSNNQPFISSNQQFPNRNSMQG